MHVETEQQNPLESVVFRIEERGYTLEEVFELWDENKDGVLTLKEI